MHLTDLEIQCIHKLAEWYPQQTGATHGSPQVLSEELGIAEADCDPLLQTMDEMGCLTDVEGWAGTRYGTFAVTSQAVQLSRELKAAADKAKHPDRVEDAQSWARRNPWIAYPIIAILALGFVITFVNQLIELFMKFGWVK